MPKSSYYFDHDYNARNDQKILELRAEHGWHGYGVYFALIEVLCESNNEIKREALGGLSLGLSLAKGEFIKLLDYIISLGLLQERKGIIFSKRVAEHLDFRALLSENGKKGGRGKKGGLSLAEATPEPGKKRKEEESKEEESKEINGADASFFDLFFSSFSFPQITAKNKPGLIEKYIAQLNGEEPHNVSFEFFIKSEFNLLNFKTDIRLDKHWLKTLQTELVISEQFIEDELKAFIAAGNINGFSSPDYKKVRTHFFNTIKLKLQQPAPQATAPAQQQAPNGQLSDEVFAAIKMADQQFTTLMQIKRAFELSEPGDPTYLDTIKQTALRPGQLDWMVDNMQDLNLTITLAYPSKREIFFTLNPKLKRFEKEIIDYHRKIKFTKSDSPVLKANFEAHCKLIAADKEAQNV